MKKAVIYARYSSAGQNEQSIAGQVEVCKKWANDNDVSIVHIYHDEAISGKTDKRPDFQRMIKDAKSKKFDYIIVYKLDRFARNRFDSATYKAQLKKYDVRIMSAMENITDGPEGIILESVLEGMAEYYSANLSQNVLRGMHQRAELGKYLGGFVPLGYKIDSDKNYILDENNAAVVRRIYDLYANGATVKEVCQELNLEGLKAPSGKPFTASCLHRILTNVKYIGRYESMGTVIEGGVPRIVDDVTFEKVQQRINQNKHAPASSKSNVKFYLTGKLFCGKCGNNMVGDSGTSHTGSIHYYYSCIEKKRKHGCTKKTIKKDLLEKTITDITINQVLTDENIEYVSKKAFELYEMERNDTSELLSLKSTLAEVQKGIDNIMKAIEQGIITGTTKGRLMELEEQRNSLLATIAKEEVKKPPVTQEGIMFYLNNIRNNIYNAEEQIEIIISTFVNAVYLFDDKLVITFNLREGQSLKKLELTDIDGFGFDNNWCTIRILSEPLMFLIIAELHDR